MVRFISAKPLLSPTWRKRAYGPVADRKIVYVTSSTFACEVPMLTIHHLGQSQSERIVWLCEELSVPYELRHYRRDAVTRLSPPEFKALHPLGAAPLIEDGDLLLAESAAIVEYIIVRHGGGRLRLDPSHPDYATYRDGPSHDGEPRGLAGGPSRAGFGADAVRSRDAARGCAPA
jgi:hypothetical protein